MPDAVPGSIIGRFGEGRFGEFRGGHITDHDQLLPAIYDAVRAGNLTFQTKVDAKVQMSDRLVCISDFALKIDVPASTGIVGKAPSLDGALDWAREPHTTPAIDMLLHKDHRFPLLMLQALIMDRFLGAYTGLGMNAIEDPDKDHMCLHLIVDPPPPSPPGRLMTIEEIQNIRLSPAHYVGRRPGYRAPAAPAADIAAPAAVAAGAEEEEIEVIDDL